MGVLVEGRWQTQDPGAPGKDGRFERAETTFRHWVTADGRPGPSGEGGFAARPGRYHLYVSYACPWAHRTLIARLLKGIEPLVPLSVVHWRMGEQGWTFEVADGATGDRVLGSRYLHEVYVRARPDYSGHVSVPVLWDCERQTIVSNESADIIRMFNDAFDALGARPGDYYPAPLRAEIDRVNARVYDTVNNGVYKAGFATTQAAYDDAVRALFESLDWLEDRLQRAPFVVGDRLTEADVRLFTTLVRFDPVYHGHFKCNLRRLVDYPALWRFTCDMLKVPGIADTVSIFHIKNHYYQSQPSINPHGIVAAGPLMHWPLAVI
ncbi:MAG TPA: glutathione S-transferase family protein [Nevskiaceae bacterium]|nr:glutathione S-transferase family protein [Nevskiaceae bacterium]